MLSHGIFILGKLTFIWILFRSILLEVHYVRKRVENGKKEKKKLCTNQEKNGTIFLSTLELKGKKDHSSVDKIDNEAISRTCKKKNLKLVTTTFLCIWRFTSLTLDVLRNGVQTTKERTDRQTDKQNHQGGGYIQEEEKWRTEKWNKGRKGD